ncbi:MAG: hypothetical protein K0S47_1988 [Herbinix sp.]|jgi:flagellar assembly protein FliH|nr:hypothetical protein [Herbinix sp.]
MRSLSNVIKAYSVNYDDGMKKTIDTHLKFDQELISRYTAVTSASEDGVFVEGLKAVIVETIEPQEMPNLTETKTKIIEQANEEARSIIEKAQKEALRIKEDAKDVASAKGYQEGLQKGSQEIQKKLQEYENKSRLLQKEYEQELMEAEPKFAHIMISLIEKITGVIVEEKEEVIHHLIHRALLQMDKSNEYTIKVSKEDLEYLISRKNDLLNVLPTDATLRIVEEINLTKNQCLIETDQRVIDCSLDVQLNNLITDLKLLGGI